MPFHALLGSRRFVHLAELRPPRGIRIEPYAELARGLAGRVDGVVVPDQIDAVLALDGRTAARHVLATGVEPLLTVNVRDRNRLALQAELLGAWLDGIRTVIVETGVDPALGDHPGTHGVYDVDAARLVGAVRRLGEGSDLAGGRLDGPVPFTVGAEVDPWKPVAVPGADFLLTAPVCDRAGFLSIAPGLRSLGVPVIVRILLLKSGGMARYLQRNVAPGRVADATVERLQQAPDKAEESVAIAAELLRAIREAADGVCIDAPGWETRIPAVLDAAR
jgi:5,10-methylenetetrahydrofolate reductase